MMNSTNTVGYDRGFFDVFFTSVGVFVTSVAASFVMVGIMMGRDTHSNWKNESDSEEDDELPFIQRFYEDFNDLEEKELDDDKKKKLLTTFLELQTDDDDKIIMRWDNDSNRFDYWCDSNITYLELDACAQKYAIDNDCKCLVVNYKQEYDNAVEKWMKENQSKDYEGAEKDSSSDDEDNTNTPEVNVFATFKNYKKKPINKPDQEKPKITTEKSNQFRGVGSITDYENTYNKNKDEKVSEKSSMVYNEWKQSQNESEDNKKDK